MQTFAVTVSLELHYNEYTSVVTTKGAIALDAAQRIDNVFTFYRGMSFTARSPHGLDFTPTYQSWC